MPRDSDINDELLDVVAYSSRAISRTKAEKDDKEKLKKPNIQNKFELFLSGDAVLAGNIIKIVLM